MLGIHRMRLRLLASTAFAGSAMLLAGAPAFAQDASSGDEPAVVDSIVVTGSRIVRSDVTSANPVTVTTGETLRESGVISLAEALRKDPAIGDGGFNQASTLSGGGASSIDLRNLGTNRSLILVNSRRMSLFTDSLQNESNDLAFMPTGMLERVEILRDGAGPTYGADAVAGVVNFILRKNFNGVELGGFYGVSQDGDAAQYRTNAIVGTATDRGSVILGLEYSHRDKLYQRERDFAASPIQGFTGAGDPIYGVSTAPGARLFTTTGNELVRCYNNDGGTAYSGPKVPGGQAGTLCPTYNPGGDTSIIGGQNNLNIAGHGEYALTNNVNVTASFVYGDRESSYDLSANPFNANSSVGPYTTGIVMPGTSSANPFGEDVSLAWRPAQYALRLNNVDASQLWADFGFNGTLDVLGGLSWDISHTYSKTTATNKTSGIPWATHLQRVLVPELCAVDPVCSKIDGGPVTNIDDLFSGRVPFTDAQKRYAFYTSVANSSFESRQTQANISGGLFSLPAGRVSYALGVEFREESGEAIPDAVAASGESISNATNPTKGKFDTKEVYGEIEIPLLSNMRFAEDLTLNLQGRYSDFSNFGDTTTYKVGLNWAINPSLRLRSSFGTSFRAPNVLELYGGGVESFSFLTDPCTNWDAAGANPTVQSNCSALGAPANYIQAAPQIKVRSGGNSLLKPEEGESLTVGFVATPSFFPDLTLTLDYYKIDVKNGIVGGSIGQNLSTCYADANFMSLRNDASSVCYGLDQRTASFNLITLDNRPQNDPDSGTASGIDWVARYLVRDVYSGDLTVTWSNTHVFEDTNWGKDVGIIYDGGYTSPKWRSILDLDYYRDNWSVSWGTEYRTDMSDYRVSLGLPGFVNNKLGYTGTKDYFLHNARFRYNMDTFGVVVGVNNVFDTKPPYVFNASNNLAPGVYDYVGRYFFMSMTKSF